jgi:hypothetical protein
MSKWITLELANGEDLDILPTAIFTFEALPSGAIAEVPEAKSHARYTTGTRIVQMAFNTAFEELERLILKAQPNRYVKVTKGGGLPQYLPSEGIVSMSGMAEGESDEGLRCTLAMEFGGVAMDFTVKETNAEIRKLITGASAPNLQPATPGKRSPRKPPMKR